MGFSERLKEVRRAKGLKQRELAEKIKATNTSVSNWENGVSQPSASVVELISQALGVSPFDLLGDYTVEKLQELERTDAAERVPEDELALVFAGPLLFQADIRTGDELPPDVVAMNIKDIERAVQGISWELLLGDGGRETLLAYDCLNAQGKTLLIDFLNGLLKVPSFIEEPDIGIDDEITAGLLTARNGLKGENG